MICVTVVMMVEPPGLPVTSSTLPSLKTSVGLIDDSGPFHRPRRVGVTAHEAEEIGCAALGGEVVELVVEQHARSVGDQARAIGQVQRIGVGDRVAVGVDDREMRGLVALIALRLAGADVGGGTRMVRRDERAQLVGVGLRGQARERDLDEVRVAEPGGAIGVGELFRLRHLVQRGGRVEALLGQADSLREC